MTDAELAALQEATTNLGQAIVAALEGQDVALADHVEWLGGQLEALNRRILALETPTLPPPPAPVGIQIGGAVGVSRFQPGWVHTQDNPTTLTDAQLAILKRAAPVQGQHLQGFGAGTIWPVETGPRNYASIDRIFGPPGHPELGFMRDATSRVLYACGCPAWMKRPLLGSTVTQSYPLGDPTKEFDYTPPHRSRYLQYATLVADIVKHTPQITHVAVWNEGKGYWANGRWCYEEYTELFNLVAAYVHHARPDVQVLGPYFVLRTLGWTEQFHWSTELAGKWGAADQRILDVVEYWLAHQQGADGLCMDVRNSNADTYQDYFDAPKFTPAVWATNPTKGATPSYWPDTPHNSWSKLDDFMTWVRKRTDLPVWMMELYANGVQNRPNPNYPDTPVSTPVELASIATEGFRHLVTAEYTAALNWRPQGDAAGLANPIALWNAAGVETGMANLDETIATHFAPGTPLCEIVANPYPNITALATPTHVLVNETSGAVTPAVVDGQDITLQPYDTQLLWRQT